MNRTRLGTLWREVDDRLAQRPAPELLSVTQSSGVVPRTALTDRPVSAADLTKYKVCHPGDLVLNRFNAYRGALGVARQRGIVSPDYLVLRPTRCADSRYLDYLLRSQGLRDAMTMSMGGIGGSDPDSSGFSRIDTYALHRVKVPAVALAEQRVIADFLDRETGKIDALIKKQTELITRLQGRWLETLQSSTTLGASGDRGHESTTWTGFCPVGWSSQRVSWLCQETSSGTTPAAGDILDHVEGTIPWVNTGELREVGISETNRAVSAASVAEYSALRIFPEGTILVAMYGATIGRLGWLGVPATTNQACCALVGPKPGRVLGKFLFYALWAARDELVRLASGGTQPNINQDKVRALRIPLPPVDEQQVIIGSLDEERSRIDDLIGKVERMIELSRERRSALITAAVTGQIDVNEHGGAA